MDCVSVDDQVAENTPGKPGWIPRNLVPVSGDTAIFGRIGVGITQDEYEGGDGIDRVGYVMRNVKRKSCQIRRRKREVDPSIGGMDFGFHRIAETVIRRGLGAYCPALATDAT
jgi:hypothetical protein